MLFRSREDSFAWILSKAGSITGDHLSYASEFPLHYSGYMPELQEGPPPPKGKERAARDGPLFISHQPRQDALTQAKYTGKQQNGNAGHKTADSPASNGVDLIEMEEPGYRPETGIIGQR